MKKKYNYILFMEFYGAPYPHCSYNYKKLQFLPLIYFRKYVAQFHQRIMIHG